MSTSKLAKRIGFLGTGSEITTGEIVNTNTKVMAERVQDYGMQVGEHLLCDDGKDNIAVSLRFLLARHDAVIITGGLGPTSDDCTVEVVAQLAKQTLKFDADAWQSIVDRLSKRNLPIPENNKRQAYFPQHAQILPNVNGTASGCYLTIDNTLLFLLPGPPRECVPMFQEQVLPILLKENFATPLRLFRWRLMNISESKIAELLDPIALKHKLEFAYRAHYPFVDIKLFLDPQTKQHTKILLEVESLVRPYFVTHLNQSMCKQLQDHLEDQPMKIYIDDYASKGAFKEALINPKIYNQFIDKTTKADLEVHLSGLEAYWQGEQNVLSELQLELRQGNKSERFSSSVLIRGEETMTYVIEFTCWKILYFI